MDGAAGDRYVIGVDYGTLSGRAVVVRVSDGAEFGSAVHEYAHGVLDRALPGGRELPPDWALQVPSDYVDVLRMAVPKALAAAGVPASAVIGIGTDFTACTVLPVLADGTPLCELPEFADRPHAYVKLWKHHAAQPHADRINALAHDRGEPWIDRYGGKLSSEWELAKGLQLLEEDPETYARMDHWVEAADWIVWQLTGVYRRNACTAGYKAVYQDGQYPGEEYLAELNPDFRGFFREKVAREIAPLGGLAGTLTAEAARWTGLPQGIAVAVGNVDAHVTAPAAKAIGPGQMVAIMGTSTCHVMNSDVLGQVPGMCGVVDGGITPGLWGYEAGQSGVGDIFAWFVQNGVPPEVVEAAEATGRSVHDVLTEQAAELAVGESGLVALDWHSGNRSVLVDHELSGLVVGLTLNTRPHEIYRALLEATAFGTRTIIEAFEDGGVPVRELVVAGGLLKNSFLMQMYADVTRRPLSLIDSEQGPALGSAIYAAVAAGAYPDIYAASEAMGKVRRDAFVPDPARADRYDALFAEYTRLHDHFGRGGNDVMHRLKGIRRAVVAEDSVAASDDRRDRAAGASPVENRTAQVALSIARLRTELVALHTELVRYGLVAWTAGNVSARVPGTDLFLIKPSGVSYDDLSPESMVLCDLDGQLVEGVLSPSSDTAAHAYVYRHMPEVGGVVHTHSTYASAWAARAESVPCVLTAMADEFGGEIPVGPFAIIGNDNIGRGIVETLSGHRSRAVLMQNHGVFTIGRDARDAVKAAVMCEDVARTVHLSRQLGEPVVMSQADIDRLYDRYQNVYGQR